MKVDDNFKKKSVGSIETHGFFFTLNLESCVTIYWPKYAMKKKVAIIMGGYSSEYKISLKSGNVVHSYLNNTDFESYRIHIFKDKWV